MAMKAAITHLTHYKYDRPVTLGPQIIRLRPAPHSRTRAISHSLKVSPSNHFVNHQQDPYGNWLARFVFNEPVREFKIEVGLTADMSVYNPFDFFVEDFAENFPFDYGDDYSDDLVIYRQVAPPSIVLQQFLRKVDLTPRSINDFIVELNRLVSEEVGYVIRMEPGVQTPEETLTTGKGSCRDSSWLLVNVLRQLGFAARFVSGYLIQLRPDLDAIDGPSGTAKDFTDLHAWTEVYLPGAGWIGLDPTSGLLTGESHIPLAATPHYSNAAPISGMATAAEVTFDFDMTIARVAEHPRITMPFSDTSWDALNALGHKVDKALKDGDVRLTMGGEPTFVSIDDFESDEWNSDATGPQKRAFADRLIRRLQTRFAPGGFLHFGQGKWYPGETLPRWTFSLYWRKDGQPIWRNPELIAGEDDDYGPGANEAAALTAAIAEELGVPDDNIAPAFEDPAEWLLKEGNLPENVSPENSELEDPEARRRMALVFERGLTEPVGFVLPVQRWQGKADKTDKMKNPAKWMSESWQFRRGKLFLVPGDSALGYRIPLSALPHLEEAAYPFVHAADPMLPQTPLPDMEARAQPVAHFTAAEATQDRPGQPAAADQIDGFVRTALSVEPRSGRLCVFMPPVESAADYLELLAAAEAAAERLQMPVHIEGYAP
ncbi:MAG: transglutaminase family protein, partial [Rhodobacteraceae bacterium]|nr:transglutaminase family protein [Paracoccaceae bacterium]